MHNLCDHDSCPIAYSKTVHPEAIYRIAYDPRYASSLPGAGIQELSEHSQSLYPPGRRERSLGTLFSHRRGASAYGIGNSVL